MYKTNITKHYIDNLLMKHMFLMWLFKAEHNS